jgi:hypothetical protein
MTVGTGGGNAAKKKTAQKNRKKIARPSSAPARSPVGKGTRGGGGGGGVGVVVRSRGVGISRPADNSTRSTIGDAPSCSTTAAASTYGQHMTVGAGEGEGARAGGCGGGTRRTRRGRRGSGDRGERGDGCGGGLSGVGGRLGGGGLSRSGAVGMAVTAGMAGSRAGQGATMDPGRQQGGGTRLSMADKVRLRKAGRGGTLTGGLGDTGGLTGTDWKGTERGGSCVPRRNLHHAAGLRDGRALSANILPAVPAVPAAPPLAKTTKALKKMFDDCASPPSFNASYRHSSALHTSLHTSQSSPVGLCVGMDCEGAAAAGMDARAMRVGGTTRQQPQQPQQPQQRTTNVRPPGRATVKGEGGVGGAGGRCGRGHRRLVLRSTSGPR